MNRVREELGDITSPRSELVRITSAFERACTSELHRIIEIEVLMPFGITRQDFVQKGREWFGETRFQEFVDQITRIDLGIELLVAGLDGYAESHLFSVSARGVVTPTALRYHAIGSGAFAALGSLYQLAYFPSPEIDETVYRTCAAKFSAENVPSVGDSTYALIIEPMSGVWTLVSEIDHIRETWRKNGQPPFPAQARRSIGRDLRRLARSQEFALKEVGKRRRREKRAEETSSETTDG
jgi:hypothetical protein